MEVAYEAGDRTMSRWKAVLPREKPEANKSHFVLAIKDSLGARFELSGTVDNGVIAPMLGELIIVTGDKGKSEAEMPTTEEAE